jgi:signal transduction histidine kinase
MIATQILVVENDAALVGSLTDAIRRRLDTAHIDASDSVHTALDRLVERDYDAFVIDIETTGTDSLSLLETIKQRQVDTPTLLIAGPGSHELAVKALREGAYDFVTKPIDEDYLVSSLGRAVQCRRLTRDVMRKRLDLLRHTEDLEALVQERVLALREALYREQIARTELDEAKRYLEDLMRQREALASSVVHELATPLSTIQGYAEILGRSSTSPEQQESACAAIIYQAGRLVRLVKDLTDTERLAADRFRTRAVRCDLSQIIREQVELARAFTSQHTISRDAPLMFPITANCDRLAQVLSSLLSNAIKHTPGGVIEVTLQQDGEEALLSVRDSGPGIPHALTEVIFEPDARNIEGAHRGSTGNAGLDLRTVKGIVEAHGGRIWVETTVGQGSTFWVALPLVESAPSDAQKAQDGEVR